MSDPETRIAFELWHRKGMDPEVYWNKREGVKVVLRAFLSLVWDMEEAAKKPGKGGG